MHKEKKELKAGNGWGWERRDRPGYKKEITAPRSPDKQIWVATMATFPWCAYCGQGTTGLPLRYEQRLELG